MPRVKPRALRPMSRSQFFWLVATIILFLVFMAVGWSMTVARALKAPMNASKQSISVQVDQTKQKILGEQNVQQKAQQVTDRVKAFFQDRKQSLEEIEQTEQVILDTVKEDLNQPLSH